MRRFIQPIRVVLWAPIEVLYYLPGGPVRHMALTRFLVKWIVRIDAPLLRLKGRLYAKST